MSRESAKEKEPLNGVLDYLNLLHTFYFGDLKTFLGTF